MTSAEDHLSKAERAFLELIAAGDPKAVTIEDQAVRAIGEQLAARELVRVVHVSKSSDAVRLTPAGRAVLKNEAAPDGRRPVINVMAQLKADMERDRAKKPRDRD